MSFQTIFPIWNQMNTSQQERILHGLTRRKVEKGEILHNSSTGCTGLLVVKEGQLDKDKLLLIR